MDDEINSNESDKKEENTSQDHDKNEINISNDDLILLKSTENNQDIEINNLNKHEYFSISKSNDDIKSIENDGIEQSQDTKLSLQFNSILNDDSINSKNDYENKINLCNKMVLTIDDECSNSNDINENRVNFKILNKLNSLSNGDFIDEDYIPNQFNISRTNSDTDDEYSNLKESNIDDDQNYQTKLNNLNINNLNESNQNFKISQQNEKLFLINSNNKSNSMENLNNKNINNINGKINQSKLNDVTTNVFSKATVLNRNDLSCSSSLSSSYSNINSNPVKSSSNSLINHFELKFDSLSSIEDNSKFNLNTNALSDSTLLISAINIENELIKNNEIKIEQTNKNINSPKESDSSKSQANIWTETEAFINQYDQVGPSACGATAILNVLKALNYEFDIETVCAQVKVNLRVPECKAHSTTLADYLFSRSIAGMNSFELIENIERVSDNKITGRFFHFYPSRDVNLSEWLANWMHKGAVPVALLNLQKSPVWGFIPDAWHHQMIYACDSNSIYLTNPLEAKSIETILDELTSESVLLVRSRDVVKRFNANKYNLIDLLLMKNHSNEEKKRWFNMNVIGQVVNVLRENKSMNENLINKISNQNDGLETTVNENSSPSFDLIGENLTESNLTNQSQVNSSNLVSNSSNVSLTSHISIPASYKSGITLFVYRDSNLYKELIEENELPPKK